MNLFCTLASGSGGNASLYAVGSARILIDAGTSTRYIAQCLGHIGLTLGDLTHVLITHGHTDHISALAVMGKHTRAKLICSEDTYYAINTTGWEPNVFTPGECFDLNGVEVRSFPTPHDAMGSCGFALGAGATSLAYCTDLGDMPPQAYETMCGCRTVVLESNHDLHMLKTGPYPPALKRRVLSANGHLSNPVCAQTVTGLAEAGARRVILAHLSAENNTPQKAFQASDEMLTAAGSRGDVELSVAPVRTLVRYAL